MTACQFTAIFSDAEDPGGNADEPLHVLDLPQLHTHPSAETIIATLSQFSRQPPSWDPPDTAVGASGAPRHATDPAGLAGYLTSIIASQLTWLTDGDDVRERIWELAATRLSERSGRIAMPPCSRTFEIPTSPETSCITAQRPGITITLHEPSLLADNLGHKTWAASYLLARRLSFFPLPGSSVSTTIPRPRHRVLELGSGTGLVGIAAAAIWGASVHLTDLPAIADNLRNNVTANKAVIEANGGEATIGVLDWAESTRVPEDEHGYDAVLAADTLYSPLHPELLVGAVRRWLRRDKAARVMIEVPLRAAYVPQIEDFRARMAQVGLRILDEGEETGYDDWGGGEMEGLTEVTCWWSIWGWCERMAMS